MNRRFDPLPCKFLEECLPSQDANRKEMPRRTVQSPRRKSNLRVHKIAQIEPGESPPLRDQCVKLHELHATDRRAVFAQVSLEPWNNLVSIDPITIQALTNDGSTSFSQLSISGCDHPAFNCCDVLLIVEREATEVSLTRTDRASIRVLSAESVSRIFDNDCALCPSDVFDRFDVRRSPAVVNGDYCPRSIR